MCTFTHSFLAFFLSIFPVFLSISPLLLFTLAVYFSLFSLLFFFSYFPYLSLCLCCFNHVLFLPLVPSFLSLIWFLPHLSFFLTASTFPYILPLLSFFCLFPPFVFFVLYSFINVSFQSLFTFHYLVFPPSLHHPPPVIFTALSLSLFALSHMFLSLFSLCSCLCFSLSPPLRPSLPLSSSSLSLVCCSVA